MTDDIEATDDAAIPPLPQVDDPAPKPPLVEPLPVPGAEGLPDDVKNGDASPGEDDPAIADRPPTTED